MGPSTGPVAPERDQLEEYARARWTFIQERRKQIEQNQQELTEESARLLDESQRLDGCFGFSAPRGTVDRSIERDPRSYPSNQGSLRR